MAIGGHFIAYKQQLYQYNLIIKLLNILRCSHKNSKIKTKSILNRKKQEKEERYPETKGVLSLAPNDDISVINESELNCCKNEITINNQLQDNAQIQVTNQDEYHTEEPSRIRHDRQRNNSAKIRYII